MNILIVGLGSIAQKHLKALVSLDVKCTVYALRHSAKSRNSQEGVINIYYLKEIEEININFCIISNPTSEHADTILKLLELKCPLFIEKPLFHSLGLDDVLLKIYQKEIFTYVACNLRFLDSLTYIKREIAQNNHGRLNEVNAYCGSFLPDWREGDYKKLYSAVPSLGGGVHMDLIHELDYLYWIFGKPEKVHSILRNVSSLDIEAFDYANYNLMYNNFCVNIILNYYRGDYKRTFELVFEDKTWYVDLSLNTVTCNNEVIFSSRQQLLDTYACQMKYFLEHLSTSKRSMNTVEEAYEVLKICLTNNINS